jgi:hypothetical protein
MDDGEPKRQGRHHHTRMNSGRAAGDLRNNAAGGCHANFFLNAHGTLCSGDSVVPTFFLIGVQKCGTTSLTDQLAETFPSFVFAKANLSAMSKATKTRMMAGHHHTLLPSPLFNYAKERLHFGNKKNGSLSSIVLPVKEVHYFDSPKILNRQSSCSYYLGKYQHAPECTSIDSGSLGIGIDATPSYFRLHKIPLGIRMFLGRKWAKHARFALILRPPEDRLLSFYNHFCSQSKLQQVEESIPSEFTKWAAECGMSFRSWALMGVVSHKQGGMDCRRAHAGYRHAAADVICASMYADNLKPWLAAFSPSQFLLVPFSKYTTDPRPALKAIGSQLGILNMQIEDKIETSEREAKHDNSANKHTKHTLKATMSPELKAELAAFFRPHNLELQALVRRKKVPVAYDDGSQAPPVLF